MCFIYNKKTNTDAFKFFLYIIAEKSFGSDKYEIKKIILHRL